MLSAAVIFFAAAAWGVFHSWLASLGLKASLRQRFGPAAERWYRLAYNVLAFLTLLPVLALAGVLPDRPLYAAPSPWSWLLLAVQLGAALFVVAGVLQTGALRFAGLSQAAGSEEGRTSRLVTGGLYRIVRHPLYLGGLVFLWATPVMTRNLFVLYLVFSVYLVAGALVEERKLLAEFGEEYRQYQAGTPMILPWPRPRH